MHSGAFGYFSNILTGRLDLNLTNLRVLDVGCGGGLFAEEFARAGCQVTGVDPSGNSLDVACAHARESGLRIHYEQGIAEKLPFPSGWRPS
ncbi:hypothetical protein GCM10012275_63560 [Longimycelium tulufanense]|uniref:Methyltransferase domain-containing protein n=1 Tax=Longimycelium tulufanense TaxID=907463 RepID=A0A8J3FZF5_9PSEU|nr:hypothetical protein GCM10012275_63560 [Longimycelium tulufanense]